MLCEKLGPAAGKRGLQIVVAACSGVPLAAGAAGVILGPGLIGDGTPDSRDLDGHFRYLSGLLFGIGLAYALSVLRIEQHRSRFLMLGGIVVLGGFGRLLSLFLRGAPSPIMLGALVMELLVTPILTLWQLHVSGG